MREHETDSPAWMFERYFGPAIFVPWTQVLLAYAAPRPGERVLDLACATGIVARHVAPIVGATGKVVALDINPDMLAVGRALPAPDGAKIEWRTAMLRRSRCRMARSIWCCASRRAVRCRPRRSRGRDATGAGGWRAAGAEPVAGAGAASAVSRVVRCDRPLPRCVDRRAGHAVCAPGCRGAALAVERRWFWAHRHRSADARGAFSGSGAVRGAHGARRGSGGPTGGGKRTRRSARRWSPRWRAKPKRSCNSSAMGTS